MKATPRHACADCALTSLAECPCRCPDCRAAEVERRRMLNEAKREVWA